MAGYVEIGIEEFRDMVETEMGFKCINGGEDGGRAKEYIYERIVQHRNESNLYKSMDHIFRNFKLKSVPKIK